VFVQQGIWQNSWIWGIMTVYEIKMIVLHQLVDRLVTHRINVPDELLRIL
jgi:hypothetical protein